MRRANFSKHLHGLFTFICVICLLPVFPLAAEGATLANLVGTWNYNSFVSGPSAPWWERGSISVIAGGTFTGSGEDSNDIADSPSGTFSISSEGIVMTGGPSGSGSGTPCQIDSRNNVLVCTDTWSSDGSSNLVIFTKKKAASYLRGAGVSKWECNDLASGLTPWVGTFTETVKGNTYKGTLTQIVDGRTYINNVSGTSSLSSAGVLTCVSSSLGCASNYEGFADAGGTVVVGTSGVSSTDTDAEFQVCTKQAASYSKADLYGTWQGNQLGTGSSRLLKKAQISVRFFWL